MKLNFNFFKNDFFVYIIFSKLKLKMYAKNKEITIKYCSSCLHKIHSIVNHKEQSFLCKDAYELILNCDEDYIKYRSYDYDEILSSFTAREKELRSKHRRDPSWKYIYQNQEVDAYKILELFTQKKLIGVGVRKLVKVGATGLITSIFRSFGLHNHDYFVVNPENMLCLTGFNSQTWEKDMKAFLPSFMTDNIYHHGKLKRIQERLKTIRNGLIIIDELDVGSKQKSVLHNLLKSARLWNVENIKERNMRFVFISASGFSEFAEFENWGSHYEKMSMTIPKEYSGIKYFDEKGMYLPNYPVKTENDVTRWINEDILPYGTDYRLHEIRIDTKSKTLVSIIKACCLKHDIHVVLHTSKTNQDYTKLVEKLETMNQHIIIILKELNYRSVLYPLYVKLKIGARMGRFSKSPSMDTIAQNQRMCGYGLKSYFEKKYRFGPFRENMSMIRQYIEWSEGSENIKYSGRRKRHLMYEPKIIGAVGIDKKEMNENKEPIIKKCNSHEEAKEYYNKELKNKLKGRGPNKRRPNNEGYYEATIRSGKKVYSCEDILKERKYGLNRSNYRYYPCYTDVNIKSTLQFWIIHY